MRYYFDESGAVVIAPLGGNAFPTASKTLAPDTTSCEGCVFNGHNCSAVKCDDTRYYWRPSDEVRAQRKGKKAQYKRVCEWSTDELADTNTRYLKSIKRRQQKQNCGF